MLSTASQGIRAAIQEARGDRSLMRLVFRSDNPPLLRWTLSTLNSLAEDQATRTRQLAVVESAFALCLHTLELQEAAATPTEIRHVVLEACCLLANLIQAQEPRALFDRLGGEERLLVAAAHAPRSGLLTSLQHSGLVARSHTAPPPGASLAPWDKPALAPIAPAAPQGHPGRLADTAPAAAGTQSFGAVHGEAATRVQARERGRRARATTRQAAPSHPVTTVIPLPPVGAPPTGAGAWTPRQARQQDDLERISGGRRRAPHDFVSFVDWPADHPPFVSHATWPSRAAAATGPVVPVPNEETAAAAELAAAAFAADAEVEAAIRLQATARGRRARRPGGSSGAGGHGREAATAAYEDAVSGEDTAEANATAAAEEEAEAAARVEAAVRMQASVRGRQARAKTIGAVAALEASDAEIQPAAAAALIDAEAQAAVKLQAMQRGKLARAQTVRMQW